jgi:UDP-2,3-diacylglucosamine pyrophosphatase LpxH
MRNLSIVIMLLLLGIFTTCEKIGSDSQNDWPPDPFSNGSSERNMIVVVSDIHLGADIAYAECNKNLGALENLLRQIRVAPTIKELVIAGDLIDEWFVPATTDTYQGKDQSDFVRRVAATNKGVFDAINQIIQEKNITVTYVPGNHDLGITAENVSLILPGINQARDAQGLGTYTPADLPVLAIEHGHRYNFACAPDPISNKDIAPGSFLPTGYFFTRIATLHVVQNCIVAGDTLAVVIPNTSGDISQRLAFGYWESWKGLIEAFPIENKFDNKIIVTNINGFTDTYAINDIVPYQLTSGGFISMNLFKNVQDTWEARQNTNNVAVHIPVAQAMANQTNNDSTDYQAKVQYFMNPESNVRIVVFGHTHHAEIIPSVNHNGLRSIYANSGTWIDSNPGTDMTTMNFVVITPQSSGDFSQTYVKLYDIEDNVIKKLAVDSLLHY